MTVPCDACDRPAKAVTLVKHSPAFVDPEMAQWGVNPTCELLHTSAHLVKQVLAYDKDAQCIVFDARPAPQ